MLKPLVHYFPEKTSIPFMQGRSVGAGISALLIVLSLALIFHKGLNFGIDFVGGILLEIRTEEPADLTALRQIVGNLQVGSYSLQEFGSSRDVLIRIQAQEGGEEAQINTINALRAALPESVEYRRVEVVGPAVGRDLVRKGIMAVCFALGAILLYIWFRFEWQYSLAAIMALIHDVIVTIGLFALLQLEFNLSTIAAVLTIAGYSINDTVVIFDRARENLRKFKKSPVADVLNLSLNETLARTILTSGTTLIALLALYFLGGEVIAGFSLAMIWGVIIGTYSTIYLATPALLMMNLRAIDEE